MGFAKANRVIQHYLQIIVCGTFTTIFDEDPSVPTLDEAEWTSKVNDELSASLTNANVTDTSISAGLINGKLLLNTFSDEKRKINGTISNKPEYTALITAVRFLHSIISLYTFIISFCTLEKLRLVMSS